MLGLGVAEHVGSFEHPRERVERGRVQRDHPVPRLVLSGTFAMEIDFDSIFSVGGGIGFSRNGSTAFAGGAANESVAR
jgi:hypothetical protein